MQPLLFILGLFLTLFVSTNNAQIVGPDSQGVYYFFYDNYTCVFLFHNIKPSIEFHPVLGGADNTYVRYNNYATFNFTLIQEVAPDKTVVATVDPLDLTWNLTTSHSTINNVTGNMYYVGVLTAVGPNGAVFVVTCETWSLGNVRPYGEYTNNISASQVEISLTVTKWPFKSMSNKFQVTLLALMDGPVLNIANPKPSPYQRSAVISSANTTFSTTLMTNGILDGVNVGLDYSLAFYTINGSLYGAYFTLSSPAFNESYYYDPNFSVLLNVQPDCSKLSNCGHGTCVQDNTCQCDKHYIQPDCVTYKENATSSEENAPLKSKKNNNSGLSLPVLIGVVVGACVVVVAIVAVILSLHYRRTRGETRKLEQRLERSNTLVSREERE